jgi:hypothetical protein
LGVGAAFTRPCSSFQPSMTRLLSPHPLKRSVQLCRVMLAVGGGARYCCSGLKLLQRPFGIRPKHEKIDRYWPYFTTKCINAYYISVIRYPDNFTFAGGECAFALDPESCEANFFISATVSTACECTVGITAASSLDLAKRFLTSSVDVPSYQLDTCESGSSARSPANRTRKLHMLC